MDNNTLLDTIDESQAIDEAIAENNISVEDIAGVMDAAVDGSDKVVLTDHHKHMVNTYDTIKNTTQGEVYAVADKEALEGFTEVTSGLVRKAIIAFSNTVPEKFTLTAKGLKHYVTVAKQLRAKLIQLTPLLEKQEYPLRDVFDYGSYSRFFQANGQAISDFYDFNQALQVQSQAMRYSIKASESYAVPLMEALLSQLQGLTVGGACDPDAFAKLKEKVYQHWEATWQDASITTKPGQTPQAINNAFPERKFTSLAPMLDNRYLIAFEPKSKDSRDVSKVIDSFKHYGAMVAFDKTKTPGLTQSMIVPNGRELLVLVKDTIKTLHDIEALQVIAAKNEAFAKDFKKAAEILVKNIRTTNDKDFFGFVHHYFKLSTSIATIIQQPYVEMTWLYIRAAMVVTALVELSVLETDHHSSMVKRFAAKQQEQLPNVALESYEATQNALKHALKQLTK